MMRFLSRPALAILAAFGLPSAALGAVDPLTFNERVACHEAIERVYYAHQIGATRSFEDAVPRRVIESKALRFLDLSEDLKSQRGIEITPAMLEAEWRRIERATRFPDRLQMIVEALGDDPMLVRECFVRPVLVERLMRESATASRANRPLTRGRSS